MRKAVGQWFGTLCLIIGSILIATAALGTVAISNPAASTDVAGAADTVVPGASPIATVSATALVATATETLAPDTASATPTASAPAATAPATAALEAAALEATAAPADPTPSAPAFSPTAQTETLPPEAAPTETAPTETAPTEAAPTETTPATTDTANAPGAPTRLVIPALGVDAPIVEVPLQAGTWDMQALTFEIAHLGGTAYPGQGSNTVLAGHVTIVGGIGPLYRLEQLPDGAEITVYVGEQAFVYTVASRERLLPTDVEIVQPGDAERLTLITCTTWDPTNRRYLERIALICTPADLPTD